MPRKTRTPATQTVSFKITAQEKRGLLRLLRQNKEHVLALTGRTNISGLARLLVSRALNQRSGALFLTRNPPLSGPFLDVTTLERQPLLDKAQELFGLQEAQQDTDQWWAENFPDWEIDKNPFE